MSIIKKSSAKMKLLEIFINNNETSLHNFDSNDLKNVSIDYITELILNIDAGTFLNYSYKNQKNYQYYEFIFKLIKKNNLKFNKQCGAIILNKLTLTNRGQHFLYDLQYLIDSKDHNLIKYNIHQASRFGTLPTFLFWKDYCNKELLSCIEEESCVLMNACANSDDRILKWIITHLSLFDVDMWEKQFNGLYYKTLYNTNFSLKYNMINSLFTRKITPKYILKRLKIISKKFDLTSESDLIICHATNYNDIQLILKLFKFYYKKPFIDKYVLNGLSSLSVIPTTDHIILTSKYKDYIDKIFQILKTIDEKNYFCLCLFSNTENIFHLKFIQTSNLNVFLINYCLDTLLDPFYRHVQRIIDNKKFYLNESCYQTLDFLRQNKVINSMIYNILHNMNPALNFYNYKSKIVLSIILAPYSKFVECNRNDKYIILFNKITHNLRILAKRRVLIRKLKKKISFYPVLKELTTYKPNYQIPVLNRGSYYYHIKNQKFNYVPPYHLLPQEIYTLNNFLIKEKADGVPVKLLPPNLYPNNRELWNYRIQAEYIEYLDLYLVFDIDIPHCSIEERYIFLRKSHPITNDDGSRLQSVYNFDMLKEKLHEERVRFKKFLDEDYDNYRWYPKASWKIRQLSESFGRDIIENIILEKDIKFIQDGPYMCDGLIITPLNGNREIKVKPKSLMTIDLLYDGDKWVDREMNIRNDIILPNNDIDLEKNTIWRCYPTGNKFKPIDLRYDKTKSNPAKIINYITSLFKYDWGITHEMRLTGIYYQKKCSYDKSWLYIIKEQNRLLKTSLDKMKPLLFKKWLDLGCGSGKLLRMIEKFNPNRYLGLDNDVNQLIKAVHKYGKYDNYINKNFDFNFVPANLESNNWNNHKFKWCNLDMRKKYDYIICNFSIMHFFTDKFWCYLSMIVKKESKMIFNLVNNKGSFNNDTSYMRVEKDVVKYFFKPVHTKEMQEPFISYDHVRKTLAKYKWKLISKTSPINLSNTLSSLYDWYIVEKL